MKRSLSLVPLVSLLLVSSVLAVDPPYSGSPAQPGVVPQQSPQLVQPNNQQIRKGRRDSPARGQRGEGLHRQGGQPGQVQQGQQQQVQPGTLPQENSNTQNLNRHRVTRPPDPMQGGNSQAAMKHGGHGGDGKAIDNRPNYGEAVKRQHRERHDRNWWCKHFTVIVFVNRGYYYWDSGYWYPAFGYDPGYDYYDYDGPIYTYGNLLPDQVILNVQRALQDQGYYEGSLNGSLNQATRQALAVFQEDNGLTVTAAIDEPTVEALGLLGD